MERHKLNICSLISDDLQRPAEISVLPVAKKVFPEEQYFGEMKFIDLKLRNINVFCWYQMVKFV